MASWGRVLPRLLASVHGQVHERVAVVHGLDAAEGRPVGFEDAVTVPQVAHEVHPAVCLAHLVPEYAGGTVDQLNGGPVSAGGQEGVGDRSEE